jgi:hypothetical protein
MAHLKVFALVAAAALGAASSAIAGSGTLNTTVTVLTPNVTYSSPATGKTAALTTYVGYVVSVSNDPSNTNTINNIVFTGTTTVTDSNEAAEFVTSDGATCSTTTNPPGSPANARTISCPLGQLAAGQAYPPFAVFFKAPVADPAGPPTPDNVQFSGISYFAEGANGPNSKPVNSTTTWSASSVLLGTSNPVLVKSAVPKFGGTLFTGAGGVPSLTNQFATTVGIPAAPTYTTAVVSISASGDPNCSDFLTCYQSQLTIPGTFSPYLSIVLRQDASSIKTGTKIESVTIVYTADDNTQTVVGLCASPTTPRTDGIPCIAQRVYYKNKSVPGWTTDLNGDFEWTLINIHNGGYKVL